MVLRGLREPHPDGHPAVSAHHTKRLGWGADSASDNHPTDCLATTCDFRRRCCVSAPARWSCRWQQPQHGHHYANSANLRIDVPGYHVAQRIRPQYRGIFAPFQQLLGVRNPRHRFGNSLWTTYPLVLQGNNLDDLRRSNYSSTCCLVLAGICRLPSRWHLVVNLHWGWPLKPPPALGSPIFSIFNC